MLKSMQDLERMSREVAVVQPSSGYRKMENDTELQVTSATDSLLRWRALFPSEIPVADFSVVEDHGGPGHYQLELLAHAPVVPEVGPCPLTISFSRLLSLVLCNHLTTLPTATFAEQWEGVKGISVPSSPVQRSLAKKTNKKILKRHSCER